MADAQVFGLSAADITKLRTLIKKVDEIATFSGGAGGGAPRRGYITPILRGTVTGAWAKDAEATVTVGGVSYKAKNYWHGLTGTGTKDCAIGHNGIEWILLSANLQQLDGYSASKTQVLASVSGSLKWLDTTTC